MTRLRANEIIDRMLLRSPRSPGSLRIGPRGSGLLLGGVIAAVVAVVATTLLIAPRAALAEGAVDPSVENARIHYQAGKSYFERGDYTAAKREFVESYQLSRRGQLLFNIALCQEKLADYAGATESLRKRMCSVPIRQNGNASIRRANPSCPPICRFARGSSAARIA